MSSVNFTFNRSTSTRRSPSATNSPRSQIGSHNRKWYTMGPPPFNSHFFTYLITSILILIACFVYLFVFRSWTRFPVPVPIPVPIHNRQTQNSKNKICDVFDGTWVQEESYPLYNSSNCPFVERGFNCLANGREDTNYLKWRWKPNSCNLPKFDALKSLKTLKGKRVIFIGDSMSRTQWESFICMLMSGIQNPNSVYEINGNQISKIIRFLGVRFEEYDLNVEFYRSPFLVQQGLAPKHGPRRVKSSLKLDKLDELSKNWVDSDLLVFNSGHWWTPKKLFDLGCYFQVGGMVKLGMSINSAFEMALQTWANWVKKSINKKRTHVFFRTFEPSHWSGANQKECKITMDPSFESKEITTERSEFGEILSGAVSAKRVPVTILNVTAMGAVRSDAHIGTYTHPITVLDCSHWCLPGVPDAWNELLFSFLETNGWRNLDT